MTKNAKYDIDTSGISDLFKETYGAASEATFNSAFPILSQLKQKEVPFVGDQHRFPVNTTFAGSVAFGQLPDTNVTNDESIIINDKSCYARLRVDRRTMKKAVKDKGAWVQGTKAWVERTVLSFTRHMELALLGDGTLGTVDTGAVTDNGGGNYDVVISAATWIEAHWEEKDFINFGSGTSQFEITVVDPDTRTITVQRNNGADVPADSDVVYVQKSNGNVPTGYRTVADATGGTLYSVNVGRRFQAYQQTLSNNETISHEILNEAVLEMERRNGKTPTHMYMSYTQYRKIKNQYEDLKRFTMRPADKRFKALVGFSGAMFESDAGDIPMIPHRFIPEDRVHLMNMNQMRFYKAPGWGWFDEDGTVFLRMAEEDAYEARYGGYGEFFFHPAFQGTIDGLST